MGGRAPLLSPGGQTLLQSATRVYCSAANPGLLVASLAPEATITKERAEGRMEEPRGEWIHEARRALNSADQDFFRPDPVRYWADFALSLLLAYGAGAVFLLA